MTVRTLAGLLPLFVSLIGFFIVLGIIFFLLMQQQPLPSIRNLKLQLLSTKDLDVEKAKEGNFTCVHLHDCSSAESTSLLITEKFRALKRSLGNSEINTAEMLFSSVSFP